MGTHYFDHNLLGLSVQQKDERLQALLDPFSIFSSLSFYFSLSFTIIKYKRSIFL